MTSFFSSAPIPLPDSSSHYYDFVGLLNKFFKQNEEFKSYESTRFGTFLKEKVPGYKTLITAVDGDFYLVLLKICGDIEEEISSLFLNLITEEMFEIEEEEFSNLIRMSYHLLFYFLDIEKEKLALENYLSDRMTPELKTKFLKIVNWCFENVMKPKDFIVSKEIKLDLLNKVNSKNYPVFFSYLEDNVNSAKDLFIKSYFEKMPKESTDPPITKMSEKDPITVSFDETTDINVKKLQKPLAQPANQSPTKEKKNIGDYMVNFDFNKLNQRRKNVLNLAYECLEWKLEEPIGYAIFENVILFIGKNPDHPEMPYFIEWAKDAVNWFFTTDPEDSQTFSMEFVNKRLFSSANDFTYDDSVNWFCFYEESPYKKLIEFNKPVLVFDPSIYILSRTNILQLVTEYESLVDDSDANRNRKAEIYNILSYYFVLGILVEPGEYFAKRNPNSALLDLWNEQILNISRDEYIKTRNLYRKISVPSFICSCSMAYCVAFVSYCYQPVVNEKEKKLYGTNGYLGWKGTKYVSGLFKKNKREVRDLKKLKPGDIVYNLHGHYLLLVDLIFEEDQKHVTFFFIHGNGWGYQPLLKKYTEGVLLDCENTPMSDYVKYEYWNQYERDCSRKRCLIEEVFDFYNFFNLLD